MAEEVKFGQKITSEPKKKPKGLILYPPKSAQSITVRFVGSQRKIYQSWDYNTKKFSCFDTKKEGYVLRIVFFVIDRVDNIVKAFICPASVFQKLGEYGSNHDFKIRREGFGLNTKYEVESLGKSEVCQDLLDKVEITSNMYPLSDIFIKNIKWELLDKEHEPITNRFEILDL